MFARVVGLEFDTADEVQEVLCLIGCHLPQ